MGTGKNTDIVSLENPLKRPKQYSVSGYVSSLKNNSHAMSFTRGTNENL